MEHIDRDKVIEKIKDYKRLMRNYESFMDNVAVIAMRKKAIIGFLKLDGVSNFQYWDYLWYGIWSTQWNKFLHLIRTYRKDFVGKRLPLSKSKDPSAYLSFLSFLDYLKKNNIRVCLVRVIIQTTDLNHYFATVIGDCKKDYDPEEWNKGTFPKDRIFKFQAKEVDLEEMVREVPSIYGNEGYI
ncbi:MAG: hypothetical protein OWQ54_05055 [Sulfolobaceae archaeon]|nr:hypothetical protein [Sulfolobaceae archaeon]